MKFNINKIISKSGDPILEINGYLTNSKYNPKKEVENYVNQHYKPSQLNIVFGYGMGYLVDELVKKVKLNEKILVIDPLLENNMLPLDGLNIRQYKNVIGIKHCQLKELGSYIAKIDSTIRTQFNVFCTHNYDKIFAEEYKKLLSTIKDLQYFNMVSDNTSILFAEKWQENLSMNLLHLLTDTTLSKLKSKFDKAVVVASSGPSLIKQLEIVKKYRDSIILISAGSTTNVLLKNNIQPDFIVSIDGGEPNYNHFRDLKIKESRLIYILENHHKIRNSFEQQAFVCTISSGKDSARYIRDELNLDLPNLFCGFTVATLSFAVALYISKGPVALIGQDLAFTNNLTHSVGHNHSQRIDENDTKKFVKVRGYYGDEVLTDYVMNSMRQSFEQMPSILEIENQYFNCTEGGAKIFGFPQMPFKDFCEKFAIENNQILIEDFQPCLNKIDLTKQLNQEISNAEKCVNLYNKALELIESDNSIKNFKSSTLKKLDLIDEELRKLLQSLSANVILQPIALYVERAYLPKENETIYQKFNRVKEQSSTLYLESQKALKKYIRYIQQAQKKLKIQWRVENGESYQ